MRVLIGRLEAAYPMLMSAYNAAGGSANKVAARWGFLQEHLERDVEGDPDSAVWQSLLYAYLAEGRRHPSRAAHRPGRVADMLYYWGAMGGWLSEATRRRSCMV